MDDCATHKKAEVRDWLTANPRIHVHFTPTPGSWITLVEVWFGIIERQASHRGSFGSGTDLNARIRAFIADTPTGTAAATRSSGPRPPTRSSRK